MANANLPVHQVASRGRNCAKRTTALAARNAHLAGQVAQVDQVGAKDQEDQEK
jgi:hypothetical protein